MQIWSRAPLRIGLAGGGTDLKEFYSKFGGLVVNATIDMYVYARITPLEEELVHFVSHDTGEEGWMDTEDFSKGDNDFDFPENMPLFFSCYRKIMNLAGEIHPHRLETYSDSPVGSGLGTSSSLCVAVIKAYNEWLDLGLSKKEVAYLAYEVERIDCGFQGGLQDQFAAAFGGMNKIKIERNGEVEVETIKTSEAFVRTLESMIILHYSGRSRESAEIISDQINDVRQNKKSLESMKIMKNLAERMAISIEQERLLETSEIISDSWEEKKKTSGKISNHEIDKKIHVAEKNGAIAAKISGAGGGGHILFIVPFESRKKFLRSLNYGTSSARVCNFTYGGAESWKLMG